MTTAAKDWASYEARLGRVTDYIYDHLDEEIDLGVLSDIACLSPWHWHRIYHAFHGETIAATVRRLRLHRAAGHLAEGDLPVAEVARRSGFGSVQAFTRAFGAAFGMPPAKFRDGGSHARFQPHQPRGDQPMYGIEIRPMPARTAVCVDHVGPYMDIGRAFATLHARLGAVGRLPAGAPMIGIYYDDPSAVPEPALRSRAGFLVDGMFPVEPPLAFTEVAAGPYAVLRYQGPYSDMKAAYRWLYGEWLVGSGREPGDAPVFEAYFNTPVDTPPTELLTEICLPLREEPS